VAFRFSKPIWIPGKGYGLSLATVHLYLEWSTTGFETVLEFHIWYIWGFSLRNPYDHNNTILTTAFVLQKHHSE
jgi:hypothetical protein